jgi:hypothetical protein
MKKVIKTKSILLIIFSVMLLSCSKNEQQPEHTAPSISFVSGDGERKLKIGESLTLTAIVENVDRPVFSWKIDGTIVSTETTFTFVAEKLGEYFVNFRVDAGNGSVERQIKVSVLEKTPPKITLGASIIAFAGIDAEFVAEAENAENAAYVWKLNGKQVSTDISYLFNQTELGNYQLSLKVVADEGEDLKLITVTVLPKPQPEMFFDDGRYRSASTVSSYMRKMTVPQGKSLVLAPVICNINDTVGIVWTVDGELKQSGKSVYYTFAPTMQGTYLISATEQGSNTTASLEVTCTPPEGAYRRSGGVKNHATTAFDYCPAPGQFINYQNGSTKAKALQDLQAWCNAGAQSWFHIGAYGGYFIVGFDHSVNNAINKADLQISGNPLATWCEQGIVWVMQDENGNGEPDDTWYELKGSETGKAETKQRLAMTYFKPAAANSNVLWMDNAGRAGSVDWNGYHQQQYYYPMFITEDKYTLTGTCIASTSGMSGGLEVAMCYNWGYVDNNSSDNSRPSNLFWIEDAIQVDGSSVSLQYIDFVKVHTATTGKGAAVGEVSTEGFLPIDLNF